MQLKSILILPKPLKYQPQINLAIAFKTLDELEIQELFQGRLNDEKKDLICNFVSLW
jgi:hypothetical protein